MTLMTKHFFFDLDKTLTKSRSAMDAEHQDIFDRLCNTRDVVVVTGGSVELKAVFMALIKALAIKAWPRGLGCTPSKEYNPAGGARVFSAAVKLFMVALISTNATRLLRPAASCFIILLKAVIRFVTRVASA